MPDEPEKQENLPGRHRPRLSELSKETTEGDLWDLDDELGPASAKVSNQVELAPRIIESQGDPSLEDTDPSSGPDKPAATRQSPKRAYDPSDTRSDAPERPGIPKASRPNGSRPLDPKSSSPQSGEVDPLHPSEASKDLPEPGATPREPSEARPERAKPRPTSEERPTGKGEKIGLIAFGAIFLILGIWWLVGLFSSISTTRIGDDQPDFPAKGEYLTIENAETYWREPVREGANPDVARREVEFIPVLNVVITEGGGGILRAIFRNEQGDFVGDSISHRFANGVFDQNANSTIEFPATDGFMNFGEFNGYRVGGDRWTVEVFEGPSAEASGSEFKLLFTVPISPNRQ